jgi:hypothetical protein
MAPADLAGRAFQSITVQRTGNEESTGPIRLWIPIVDGTERLGVMELHVADRDRAEQITLDHCRMLDCGPGPAYEGGATRCSTIRCWATVCMFRSSTRSGTT